MKSAKKTLSVLICALLIVLSLPLAAGAADYGVNDYASLAQALSASSSTVRLTDDITLPSEETAGYGNLTVPSPGCELYLNGHTLNLGAYGIICNGSLSVINNSTEKGTIVSDTDTLTLRGTSSALSLSSGVKVESRNGDAVVSNVTAERNITIQGAEVKADNGSAVKVAGYGTRVYFYGTKLSGKYGITSDFSSAPKPSRTPKTSNIYILSGTIDASDKVFNNNTSDVGNGYTNSFYNLINFHLGAGAFSKNIYEENPDIKWKMPDSNMILTTPPELVMYGGYYTIIPEISSQYELAEALENGGIYSLVCGINISSALTVKADTTVFCNGSTLKANSSLVNMFEANLDNSGKLTIEDAVLDGNSMTRHAYLNNSPLNSDNTYSGFALKNCTVKNFRTSDFKSTITTKGSQSLELENCVFDYDTFPIDDESPTSLVYVSENCNASIKNCDLTSYSTSSAVINDGNLVIDGGEYKSPDGYKTVINNGSASLSVKDGTFSSELYKYISEDKFMVRVRDNTSDGKYIIKDDFDGAAAVEDVNLFGLNYSRYLNLQLLGVQKKHEIPDVGVSKQEELNPDNSPKDNSIRFVTVLNEGLVKGNNIADYGYVVAKVNGKQPDEIYPTRIFDIMKCNSYNGEKTISCMGTKNEVVDENFGNPENNLTTYKYVTLSVNNIDEGCSVAARFYVKTKDGKYYYSDYIKGNETLKGIVASVESLN